MEINRANLEKNWERKGKKIGSLMIPETADGTIEDMVIVLSKDKVRDLGPKEIAVVWEFFLEEVRSVYLDANLAIIQDAMGNEQIYINTGKKCKCRAYFPWKNK